MRTDFCLDALEAAIRDCGIPKILNTDQGSQFTGTAFVGLVQQHGIQLSMDGKGSWRDNLFIERLWKSVKYEEVYLDAYDPVAEAHRGLACYFLPFTTRAARTRPLTARLRIWSTLPGCPSVRQRNVNLAELHLERRSSCPTPWSHRSLYLH